MADVNRLYSVNISRVIRTIWLNPGISRINLAQELELNRSTVTKIMQVVQDRKIVKTEGKDTADTGVGRKQIRLVIDDAIGVALGIEIREAYSSFVIVGIDGTVLDSYEEHALCNVENVVDHTLSLITRAKEKISNLGLQLLGIGIAIPGVVDPYTGVILKSILLDINESFDYAKKIKQYVKEPIFIENDANCCCWGELSFSLGKRHRNFVVVLGELKKKNNIKSNAQGLSLGVGIVIREKVLHGDYFTVGEFRAVGACYESGQFKIPYQTLDSLPEDEEVFDAAYQEIADNIAFLANMLNLTKIVFCADFVVHPRSIVDLTYEALNRNKLYDFGRNFEVAISERKEYEVAFGAASLFLEKLFSVPDVADKYSECVGYDLLDFILTQRN